MKHVHQLEKYARSIPHFPFNDLEVDWKEVGKMVVVSIYWTGVDGHTCAKDVTIIPHQKFFKWVMSSEALITIKHAVKAIMKEAGPIGNRKYTTPIDKTVVNADTGETVTLTNVKKFCRERNIPYDTFKKMIQGRSKTSHGWSKVIY